MAILTNLLPLLLATLVAGQNVTETGALPSFSPTPASTSVPEPSSSPDEPVPGQGMYPAVQAWCEEGQNATYCPGVVSTLFTGWSYTDYVVDAGCTSLSDLS
jgi:alpha,alpha-trehalase